MISNANPKQSTNTTSTTDINPRPRQRITARALLETKRLSDPQIHPDGLRVAFVATEADFDESHWISHLWLTEFVPPEEEEEQGTGNREQGTGGEDSSFILHPSSLPAPLNPQPSTLNSEDLTRQLTFSRDGETQPRWSPDGRYLAFLSARPDETQFVAEDDDDDATEQVWILPIDGGEARKVTSAREGVLDYEWIGDTNSIAYLASEPRPRPLESLRKDERHRRKVDPIVEQDDRLRRQLWRVDVDDEKPKLLLTGDYGVSEFALSPDGERLAFITNYSGEGNDYHLADLYVRYLSGGRTVKLIARTGGKYHLRWSPDGSQLAFLSWLDPQLSYSRECVFVTDVPQEAPAHASTEYGQNAPGLTDCRLLADIDYDLSAFEWARPIEDAEEDSEESENKATEKATEAEESENKQATNKESATSENVSNPAFTPRSPNVAPPVLGYALAAVRTGSEIAQITPGEANESGEATENTATFLTAPQSSQTNAPSPNEPLPNEQSKIQNPPFSIDDLALDPGGHSVAYVQESAQSLPEIFLRDETGAVHQLTQLNADFAKNYRLPHQEVVSWTSPDGLVIEGVLTLPGIGNREQGTGNRGETSPLNPDVHPQGRTQPPTTVPCSLFPVPLIVQIHGGPKGRSTNTLQNYSMAPVWAAEGYAVLRPNFRGSEGYGNEFAIANRRDLGGGDFADIMAGVDWCIAQSIADPEKLGVMGGSYGGYMTNWAIGHTNRFKAAVSMFGIFHLQTDYSNSELSRWENEYAGAYYWEDPEIYRRMSPGTYLDAIQTPTLIIHGDEDSNTFISNSKEMYQALRHRGVTAQFVHYPREGHGLREPNHKMDEIRRCLNWMDKYLRHAGQNPSTYRMGDKVPSANGLLELCVTRADLATFVGQPKPEKDAPNPTELLEIVFTISNKDTREHVPPLLLPLATIRLEEEEKRRKRENGIRNTEARESAITNLQPPSFILTHRRFPRRAGRQGADGGRTPAHVAAPGRGNGAIGVRLRDCVPHPQNAKRGTAAHSGFPARAVTLVGGRRQGRGKGRSNRESGGVKTSGVNVNC